MAFVGHGDICVLCLTLKRNSARCESCGLCICSACYVRHPCLPTKEDFGDSPRIHKATDISKSHTMEPSEALERACSARCFFRMKDRMYVYAEPFDHLNNITISNAYGTHMFGSHPLDVQQLCEALAWSVPEGIVGFHKNLGRALVFQPGRTPAPLCISSAFSYLRDLYTFGLVIYALDDGRSQFTLLEVHRYRGQTLKLDALRSQLLRAIEVLKYGVAFL